MKKYFLIEYHPTSKLKIRGYVQRSNRSVLTGWLFYEDNFNVLDDLVKSNPTYKDHAMCLKLIPKEIIMLCDILTSAVPAADWLNTNYPDLSVHAQ